MQRSKKNNGESAFDDTYDYVHKLEKKNNSLSIDNAELAKKLNSKRYKAVDFLVDSTYSILRGKNKKKALIERNINLDKNRVKPPQPARRKVVKGRIDIINVNFFDWDGDVIYKGGAERYVYDLAFLLKKNNYHPRILQCSNVEFKKEYRDIEIIGIGDGSRNDMRKNSYLFSRYCNDAELIIASPLELASEISNASIVGINHGINFDGDWNKYDKKCLPNYDVYMDALRNVVKCVCVDTNFINWTRTLDYDNSLKEVFIPNYYDKNQFGKIKKHSKEGKIVFVYPRRIYDARGADITIKVFDKVLKKYKEKIIINFVGQVDNEQIGKKLDALMKKYPENVFHYEYDMEEMHKAYESADVVLVPTRYCEGTSLSCIEGMVSGAAIITTNVGGLPNLVIDEYNGKLISPVVDDLEKAVIDLIENPEKRKRLAINGQNVVSSAFEKGLWDERWITLVNEILNKKTVRDAS